MKKIQQLAGDATVIYADGYKPDSDEMDEALLNEAKEIAARADVAVVFAGLPERYESEGYSSSHI